MQIRQRTSRWLAVLGAGLCLVGAFLPWMELSATTFADQTPYYRAIPGVEEWPGKLVVVLALLALVITWRSGQNRSLAPLGLGMLIAGLAWYWYDAIQAWQDLNEIEQGKPNPAPLASMGVGYYVIAAGVLLLVLSSVLARMQHLQPPDANAGTKRLTPEER